MPPNLRGADPAFASLPPTLTNTSPMPCLNPPDPDRRSIISVMPNSSYQRSEKLDIRVAGGDMHSTSGTASSNLNLTLNIVGYSDSCAPQQQGNGQEEWNGRSANIMAPILQFLRARFPFFTSSSFEDEHQESPTPSSPDLTGSDIRQTTDVVELSNIDQAITNTLNTAPQEIYVHTLLKERLGLPCWEPRPSDPQNQPRGVVPGDVGTYTIEGGFERLFNLLVDKETLCDIQKACGTEVECQGLKGECRTSLDWMRSGDAVAYGASTEKPLKRLLDRPIVDVLYEFHCHSSTGAILATPSSADKDEVRDLVEMERYVCTHAEAIYRHANSITRVGEGTSLYIVSGCVKSHSWAMAAYGDEMDPNHKTLQLVSVSHSSEQGGSSGTEYRWTKQGLARARCGWSSTGMKDQSLFLRGFKLAFSPQFCSRVGKGNTGNDRSNAPGPTGAGGNSDPPGRSDSHPGPRTTGGEPSGEYGPCGKFGRGQSGTSGYNRPLEPVEIPQQIGESPGDQGLDCTLFPSEAQPPYHPSDVINSCILQQTGCDIAICHDNSWVVLSEVPSSLLSTAPDVSSVQVNSSAYHTPNEVGYAFGDPFLGLANVNFTADQMYSGAEYNQGPLAHPRLSQSTPTSCSSLPDSTASFYQRPQARANIMWPSTDPYGTWTSSGSMTTRSDTDEPHVQSGESGVNVPLQKQPRWQKDSGGDLQGRKDAHMGGGALPSTQMQSPPQLRQSGSVMGPQLKGKGGDTNEGRVEAPASVECTNCQTTNTPLWRRDSEGQALCNACGLFFKIHGVARPLGLRSDTAKNRNRAHGIPASTSRRNHSASNSMSYGTRPIFRPTTGGSSPRVAHGSSPSARPSPPSAAEGSSSSSGGGG